MPNQKQRREAARRHLERQLKARQAREARRKRITLIASIVGTLALIAAVVVVVVATSGDDKKTPAASGNQSSTPSTSVSTPPACGGGASTPMKNQAAKGDSVSFDGVTVKGAKDLTGKPVVTSHGTKKAAKLVVKDLVVGKGEAASPTSCVNVMYSGVLYTNGHQFDSSWDRGTTTEFSLQQVVPGFTQGIGGGSGVAPMKVGGRRIIIVPSAMGYGAQANGADIPANSDLVFIVDLKSLRAAN